MSNYSNQKPNCLSSIDFSDKGPFGKLGAKLKKRLIISKQEYINKKTVDYEEENHQNTKKKANRKNIKKGVKNYINQKYYNLRVPGS